jgi:uncharacterized protein (TIGR02588 family)
VSGKKNGTPVKPNTVGRPIPRLEWAIAGMGALLVGTTIAYLVYQALWRDETPPDVRVAAERVVPLQEAFLVEFRATNRGSQAAAQLLIEGQIEGPDGVVETSEATLDYLPPNSYRNGGLFFTRDPRRLELRLTARGYAEP